MHIRLQTCLESANRILSFHSSLSLNCLTCFFCTQILYHFPISFILSPIHLVFCTHAIFTSLFWVSSANSLLLPVIDLTFHTANYNFLNVLSLGFEVPQSLGHGASGSISRTTSHLELVRSVHIIDDTAIVSVVHLLPSAADTMSPPNKWSPIYCLIPNCCAPRTSKMRQTTYNVT